MRRFTFSLLPFLLFLSVSRPALPQAQVTGTWQTLPYLMPINPIHVVLMHTGKVLIVAGSENDPNQEAEGVSASAIWDPKAGVINVLPNLGWDLFCNGMAALADGRPIIVGGTHQYDPFWGGPEVTVFDPARSGYMQVQSMAHGRWYATSTMLGDGRILAFSGYNESGAINNAVEIYKVGAGWSSPSVAPFSPPLYPRLFLLPNGNVFYTGTGWFSSSVPNTSSIFSLATQTWTMNVAKTVYTGDRKYGTAVLLPLLPANNYAPRVMLLGGGSPGTASTEIIDLSAATPKWTSSGNMTAGRAEMDAILLPNGKVLAEAGSPTDEVPSTATLAADLFDPATGVWSSAGTATYSRLYHSVALLMPDATVWVAGSNPQRGTYEQHMEIWTPPYLYTTDSSGNPIPAPRPSMTSAPATIGYGGSFQVSTPNASDIKSVVLMRPGSSSHAFDFDQRAVGLTFTSGADVLNVNGPPNSNIAPPGYYMLFILNSAGVPSIAPFVLVSGNPTDLPPKGSITSPPGNLTIQPGQTVNFAGSGSDSDGTVAAYSWVFQGGMPVSSSTQNPGAITYSTPGTYIAGLTAVDNLGVNDPSPPTRTITVQNAATGAVRVHAGGPAYTDPSNQVWIADTGSSGASGTSSTTHAISGTNTQPLYQTERFGSTFQYQFSVPNGNYAVTLKFAEIFWTTPGKRVFNVAINSQPVLSNFDIVQAVGPYAAIDKTFNVSVTAGKVTIQFTTVVDNAKISAIQIVSGSAISVAVSPKTVTLGQAQTQQFTANVSGTTNTSVSWSISPPIGTITSAGFYTAPATISSSQNVIAKATSGADGVTSDTATITLLPPGGFTPIRVNAGGPAYTDPSNQAWSADTGSSGSVGSYTTTHAISGTNAQPLYQSERWGGSFQYKFNVPNGTHAVTLKFAEIYWLTPGKRVFNVAINGQPVLSNFDIVQAVGPNAAIDKTFNVSVTGGLITIQFTRVVDNAKISAIQIQ